MSFNGELDAKAERTLEIDFKEGEGYG